MGQYEISYKYKRKTKNDINFMKKDLMKKNSHILKEQNRKEKEINGADRIFKSNYFWDHTRNYRVVANQQYGTFDFV